MQEHILYLVYVSCGSRELDLHIIYIMNVPLCMDYRLWTILINTVFIKILSVIINLIRVVRESTHVSFADWK
jgi:hypothetical protein